MQGIVNSATSGSVDVQCQQVKIHRLKQVRRFAAGCRTGIEYARTGRRRQQFSRTLCSRILYRYGPVSETGQDIDRYRRDQN